MSECSESSELLEETELEVFEELFHFTEELKQRRQELTRSALRQKAVLVFRRLNISEVFLDQELIDDFMTQRAVSPRAHSFAIMKIRQERALTKTDLIKYFSQKLVEKFDKQFQLDQVRALPKLVKLHVRT